MSRTQTATDARETRTELADPIAAAFAIAESLAPASIRSWLIHGHDSIEQRGSDSTAVYDALVSGQHDGSDPQGVVISALEEYVTDSDAKANAVYASTSVLNTALDAGYLYGLAVGLTIAKGGIR